MFQKDSGLGGGAGETYTWGLKIVYDKAEGYMNHNGVTYVAISTTPISFTNENHLVMVYDSSAKVCRLFLNDIEMQYAQQDTVPGDGTIDGSDSTIRVGNLQGCDSCYFDGKINDLKIYQW